MPKKPRNRDGRLVGWSETDSARALGITYQTFREHVRNGVFPELPRNAKGRDIREVFAAWLKYQLVARAPDSGVEFRRQRESADARIRELRALEMEGRLVELEEVGRVFAEAMQRLSRIDGAAGRIAEELAGVTDPALRRTIVLRELRAFRAEAADVLETLADSEDRGADPPPSSGPDA